MTNSTAAILTLIVTTIIVTVVGGFLALDRGICKARWSAADRLSQWGPLSGCLVYSQGHYVPEDRIWYERNK